MEVEDLTRIVPMCRDIFRSSARDVCSPGVSASGGHQYPAPACSTPEMRRKRSIFNQLPPSDPVHLYAAPEVFSVGLAHGQPKPVPVHRPTAITNI